MIDVDDVLRRLLSAPKVTRDALASVPTEQGVYVLWLTAEPPVCLKVGIAGPRQGKGLRERLRNHFGSDTSNSVLARHLAADCTSRWCVGHDFTDRAHDERSSRTAVAFRLWRFRLRHSGNSNRLKPPSLNGFNLRMSGELAG